MRQGKVQYIGTSNFAGWQLAEALWASERHHLVPIVAEQPQYSLLDRHIEREVLPACRHFGVAVLPWGSLKGGELTGKYRLHGPLPAQTRQARQRTDTSAPDWRQHMELVEALRLLAAAADLRSVEELELAAVPFVERGPAALRPVVVDVQIVPHHDDPLGITVMLRDPLS